MRRRREGGRKQAISENGRGERNRRMELAKREMEGREGEYVLLE